MHETERAMRRDALHGAKRAVRAYTRDPSDANATEVEEAWRRVRQIDALARWRQAASLDGNRG